MTKRTPAVASAPAPVPQPVQTPARDEYTGLGGTYVRDPATGQRARLQPPEAPGPADFPTLNTKS